SATVTALSATPDPARADQPVTLTATVTAAGVAVTDGTVTFREAGTALAAGIRLHDQGQATYTTSLGAGTHSITATYQPAAAGRPPPPPPPRPGGPAGRGPAPAPPVAPAPTAAGWPRAAVTVTWHWADHGAGIDPAHCPTRSTTTGQGSITLTATCLDRAGNH